MINSHSLDTIPNSYLRLFFGYFGGNQHLLVNTSQTKETLTKLGGFHTFEDYCIFLKNAAEFYKDPAIGFTLGMVKHLSTAHGAMGTAAYNSPTVYDCLQIIMRFIKLRMSNLEADWLEDDEIIGLKLSGLDNPYSEYNSVTELALLSIRAIVGTLDATEKISPSKITLNYPAPSYEKRYHEVFDHTEVEFSKADVCIMYSKEKYIQSIAHYADPTVRSSAVKRCNELLKGIIEDKSYRAQIHQLFNDNPGHIWSLSEISQQLHMSSRTLQRRLNDENNSFQQVQVQWLKQQTTALLLDKRLTVESIALMLGYTDVSTFRQFCKRWFGKPPIELRAELAE
jgi:AraC-like DNA-binding protein